MLRFRFEVYVGKRETADSAPQAFDNKTGAAAVVRNQIVMLGALPQVGSVVIDQFYTSVTLALQLLAKSVYVLGTIMTNRLVYDKREIERRQIPRAIERVSITSSRLSAAPP